MKIVFASNYFNHHQKPFCDAMYALIGDDFSFVETMPMEQERLDMGWGSDERPSYIKQSFVDEEHKSYCQKLIDVADVAIYGSTPYGLLAHRIRSGKLTFKYAERPYKLGCPFYKLPWHFYLNTKKYRRYKNLYLLCASAYASGDYARTITFRNKAYKWGYFTELKQYADVDHLIAEKTPASILWTARLIPLKHPESALAIAQRLKAEGYQFKLDMIGNGEMAETLQNQIREKKLDDCVSLLGAMKPEQVREYMEKSEIFLFTSDKNEGWGAVLNESMNSACAVIASHVIGSVPFLVKDGENGLIYKSGDVDDLYQKVKFLLDNSQERKRLAKNAYTTMAREWNAENAARKLLQLCEQLLAGEKIPFPYADGVCSKAEILKDDWYK